MHAQRGCQFQDIQKRKIPFAAFDISRIAWMNVRQFGQFRQCHSALVAELPNCFPENDLFALVFRVHTMILDYDAWTNNRAKLLSVGDECNSDSHDNLSLTYLSDPRPCSRNPVDIVGDAENLARRIASFQNVLVQSTNAV